MSVMMQTLHPSATPGANSVIAPAGVMRAIFAGAPVNSVPSVNQRLPSEPSAIARGWLFAVGTLNCFSAAIGAACATHPSVKTATIVATSTRPASRVIAFLPRTGRPHGRTQRGRARLDVMSGYDPAVLGSEAGLTLAERVAG